MLQLVFPFVVLMIMGTADDFTSNPSEISNEQRSLDNKDGSCVFPLMVNMWSMSKDLFREFQDVECRKKSFCELSHIESNILGESTIKNSTTFSWLVGVVEIFPRHCLIRSELEEIKDGATSGKRSRSEEDCSNFYPDCKYPFRNAHFKMIKWLRRCEPVSNFQKIMSRLFASTENYI